MTDWSLESEYFALILLAVIALFYCDAKALRGFRQRRVTYWACLGLTALSILLNAAAVDVIENIQSYSVSLAMGLNTAYFAVSWMMTTAIVHYLFLRILEFVYDGHCMRIANTVQCGLLTLFMLLLIYNIPSGLFFYFDGEGIYHRGVFNAGCYLLPIAETAMLIICYFRNRENVSSASEKVLFVAAPCSLLLILYQTVYPAQLLNGSIAALVNLIIFISFRGGRAEQDNLTGLDNHRCLVLEVKHRTAKKKHYQVILVRLRNFSRINRAYGENGGNALLFKIGEALESLATDGRAFRYGDDEFALMFKDADPAGCTERLRLVAERMRRRWKLGAYDIMIPFSAIELRYSGEDWGIEDISGYLNDAVHLSVTNDIEEMPFDMQIICERRRKEEILQSMTTAFAENRFEVWYQPVYYRKSGKFESAEALIRMKDRNGIPISPSEFIPVAEETGIVDDISLFVLENVCRLLKSGAIPELKAISINLPIHQVVEDDLKEQLRSILQRYKIEPHQVKLEITERDVVQNGYAAVEAMSDLTELGYRFMLDDFGIGYSNLARVMALPLDTIKIDRSLVLLLEHDEKHMSFIRDYMVPLFRQLGQHIVAEGVETKETADTILGCGIDCIQGFYYAKPMPERELLLWYAAKNKPE